MSKAIVLVVACGLLAGWARADSFESGDLSGWTSSGNGSTQLIGIGDLSPLGPLAGNYSALIGNGPGDVGNDGSPDTGVFTSSSFSVGVAGADLSFLYDFLTFEFTGLDAFVFDFFTIELVPTLGSAILLISGDVSLSGFGLIDGGNPVAAPDGSTFFEHLGSTAFTTFVAEGIYSLRITVSDDFDGSGDSALLFDSFTLSARQSTTDDPPPPATDPVPEPGTLLLVAGVGAAGALALRRRSGV